MANAFKVRTSRAVGTGAATTIGSYSVGVSTIATVIGCTIANITANTISVSAYHHDGGANATAIVKDATLVAGGTLVVIGGDQKLVLEAGHSIRANSSAASSIDVTMSFLEIT